MPVVRRAALVAGLLVTVLAVPLAGAAPASAQERTPSACATGPEPCAAAASPPAAQDSADGPAAPTAGPAGKVDDPTPSGPPAPPPADDPTPDDAPAAPTPPPDPTPDDTPGPTPTTRPADPATSPDPDSSAGASPRTGPSGAPADGDEPGADTPGGPPTGPATGDEADDGDDGDDADADEPAADADQPTTAPGLVARAFLDLDADGRRDSGERGVPGLRFCVSGSEGSWSGAAAGDDAPTLPACRRTDGSGATTFPSLEPGPHRVRLALPAGTTTTGGAAQVDVPERGRAEVEFGVRGTGTLRITGAAGPDRVLVLRWAGGDGVFGTGDDVLVTGVLRGGVLTFRGLPPGTYRLEEGGVPIGSALVVGGQLVRVAVPARGAGGDAVSGQGVGRPDRSSTGVAASGGRRDDGGGDDEAASRSGSGSGDGGSSRATARSGAQAAVLSAAAPPPRRGLGVSLLLALVLGGAGAGVVLLKSGT